MTQFVWSGRASQEVFVELAVSGLHQCIRPLVGARWAPGHHGNQRACDLITGQASVGHLGHQCSQVPGRPILHLFSSSRRPRRVIRLRQRGFRLVLSDQAGWIAASATLPASKLRPWARTPHAIRASLLARVFRFQFAGHTSERSSEFIGIEARDTASRRPDDLADDLPEIDEFPHPTNDEGQHHLAPCLGIARPDGRAWIGPPRLRKHQQDLHIVENTGRAHYLPALALECIVPERHTKAGDRFSRSRPDGEGRIEHAGPAELVPAALPHAGKDPARHLAHVRHGITTPGGSDAGGRGVSVSGMRTTRANARCRSRQRGRSWGRPASAAGA